MFNKLMLVSMLFLPALAFSQPGSRADSANKIKLEGGPCDRITFTKVEKLPSLTISKQAFEDSLSSYLKTRNAFNGNEMISFRFVVTCHAEIREIERKSGDQTKEQVFKDAILKFSHLWVQARQNNYIVNSYVLLSIKFTGGRLSIDISQ